VRNLSWLFAAYAVTVLLLVGYDLWLSLKVVALRRGRRRP
jgi:hypothetical protein